ncbi:ABC transporter ATP-binding protein [Saccharomonospora sp. NPDC006951]
MRLYLRTIGEQWRALLVLLACSVIEAVPAFATGWLVERAVSDGFQRGGIAFGIGALGVLLALFVVGALGSLLVFSRLGSVVEPLRDVLAGAVVRGVLGMRALPRSRIGESDVPGILRRIEDVRQATGLLLGRVRGLVVTAIAAMAGLFVFAWQLALIAVVPVLLSAAIVALSMPTLLTRQRDLALAHERAERSAADVFAGMRDVVSCGAEATAAASVCADVDRQERAALAVARVAWVRTVAVGFGVLVPFLGIGFVAPGMVAAGQLTPGAAFGVLCYLALGIVPAFGGLATTSGTAGKLFTALHGLGGGGRPDPLPAGSVAPAHTGLSLRGVTFRWGPEAEPVVDGLSLDLVPGDRLTVVGETGLGKSTFAALLMGQLEPERGRVLLGGEPVSRIAPAERHGIVGYLPSEPYLFAGSVRENLAVFSMCSRFARVPDGRLLASIAAVGADEVVERLGGLSGEIGHRNRGLSAADAQLLALARLYASSAKVVVLDEATSHLSAEAEARVERAFAGRGGILVVMASRQAPFPWQGRVLVLGVPGHARPQAAEIRTQDAEIGTQDAEIGTQDGEIRAQDGEIRARDGEIRAQDAEIRARGVEDRRDTAEPEFEHAIPRQARGGEEPRSGSTGRERINGADVPLGKQP